MFCIYVFCTGMKEHNCLRNARLSFMIINLRKALKNTPHTLKALLRNGFPSPDCLFCLDPLSLLPELRWALVPTELFSASYLCVCLVLAMFSNPLCASPHLPCLCSCWAVRHGLNALELLQASAQPVEGPGDLNVWSEALETTKKIF